MKDSVFSKAFKQVLSENLMPGGHSGRETPGLIPNPEVKPSSDSVCTALTCGKAETLPGHLL